jgi:hypothetical protein
MASFVLEPAFASTVVSVSLRPCLPDATDWLCCISRFGLFSLYVAHSALFDAILSIYDDVAFSNNTYRRLLPLGAFYSPDLGPINHRGVNLGGGRPS